MTQKIPEWFHAHGQQTELQNMLCSGKPYTLPIRCFGKTETDVGILIWRVSQTWWSIQYQRESRLAFVDMYLQELEAAFGLKRDVGKLSENERCHYNATHVVFEKFIRNGTYLALPGPASPHDTSWRARAVSIRLNSKIREAVRELISCSNA